jgi:hypothetical protein
VADTFRQFIVAFALGGDYERLVYAPPPDQPGDWDKPEAISFEQASLEPDDA